MPTSDLETLAAVTITRRGVPPEEIAAEIAALGPRWSVRAPDLRLDLKGPMTKTGAAAAYAGALADELDHHPTIVLEYAGMTLTIHTHDKQAITVLDLVFAARLEQWLRTNGFPA
jgi:pterin-4a-carbinolamine dehydratase